MCECVCVKYLKMCKPDFSSEVLRGGKNNLWGMGRQENRVGIIGAIFNFMTLVRVFF